MSGNRSESRTDDGAGGDRLLRPAARCPRCGKRPALRVSESVVRAARACAPGARVGTYRCPRLGCGMIYDLTAAAFGDAA